MINRRTVIRQANRRVRGSSKVHQLDVQLRSSTTRRRRREWISRFTVNILLLLVIGGASFYGVHAALDKFFFNNTEYTLKTIQFDLDDIMTREEALADTGLREGINIFSVDLAHVESTLKANSQVREVRIERRLPDQIAISLVSRDPVAWIAAEGDASDPTSSEHSLLVDAEGSLMRPRHLRPEHFHLPVITGLKSDNLHAGDALQAEDLRLALKFIETVANNPQSLLRIRTMDVSKGYCIQVVDQRNAGITFATTDFEEQLSRLQQLLAHCEETGRTLESVNLMVRRNTPVTFVVAAAPETGAGKLAPTTQKSRRN